MGMSHHISLTASAHWVAERNGHLLHSSCSWLVRQGHDPPRLLVLLGSALPHRPPHPKLTLDKILSISFELAEYSLQHQLPNFAEVRTYLSCPDSTDIV